MKSVSVPKTVHEVLSHSRWCAAIVESIALDENCTWNLISLLVGNKLSIVHGQAVDVNPEDL